MFNYRPAKKQDKAALQSLWEECFPEDKGAFSAWYFTELFQPENVYVAETSTKITGSLYAPPLKLKIAEKIIKVPYLQGIATAVSHRNLGIAKNLIAYSLKCLQEQGYNMAVLEPFLPLFYEKQGFRTFAKANSLELSIINNHALQNHNKSRLFSPLETNPNLKQLNNIYQIFGKSFYSHPLRDSKRWQNLLYDHKADGGKILATEDAYLLYFMEGNTIKIRELAYKDEAAAINLLRKTKDMLCASLFVYTEQPQAMYYALSFAAYQKGTPILAFPAYHNHKNYFNELF
jgi:predicted acetyltransferase